MGLDGVELVMECEDEFGITISNEDASRVRTVADLYALICRLRQPVPPSTMMAAIAAAMKEAGLSPNGMEPSSRLADLVPPSKRQAFWSALGGHVGRSLPKMQAPTAGCAASLASIILCAFLGAVFSTDVMLVGLLVGALLAWSIHWTSKRTAPRFPTSWVTVQDVIDSANQADGLTIWNRLVRIICEQLGVRPDDIKLETRFVEDLNVD